MKAAKTKVNKGGVCSQCAKKPIDHCSRSLDASSENRVLNLRTKDKPTNDTLLFVRVPQIQGIMCNRVTSSTEQLGTGFNPQYPLEVPLRLHRSAPKDSCQMRSWDIHVAHKTLLVWRTRWRVCAGISNKSSLYSGPAPICTFITPWPSRVLPKTLIISMLRERYSNYFISTTAAELISRRRVTVLSAPLLERCSNFFY